MRYLSATLLALMIIVLAPLALAEGKEDPATNDSEQAWVDDCPPDMMCAMDGGTEEEPREEQPHDEPYDDGPTYDGNCGGEVCAYDDGPGRFGDDDCIDCTKAPDQPTSDTCMDGQQDGEACDDDKQYFGDPDRGPSDGTCEYCRGDTDDTATPISAPAEGADGDAGVTSVNGDNAPSRSPVPAPALGLALAGMAVAAILMVARRD